MAELVQRPALGAIRAVTYAVPDLAAIEAAYTELLGYRVVARGKVSPARAASWDAPAMAGRPLLALGPRSGEPVNLCFVQSAAAAGWRALTTYGWNATEFVTQDVDALAERLASGPFEIIGPPKPLTRFPMIRAMQAIGPAGECCYFTEVGPGSGLDLAEARSFVGRVFIAVGAGPEVNALFEPYSAFGNRVDPPVATPVQVISAANGLPLDTLHPHGLVRLSEGTMVELDGYPSVTTARRTAEGELPPGMAIVSFAVDSLGSRAFIGPPAPMGLPGGPETAASLRGAAGELIELVAPEQDWKEA